MKSGSPSRIRTCDLSLRRQTGPHVNASDSASLQHDPQALCKQVNKAHDVAALYIDPRGPYPSVEGVDCWDAARDARRYAGPWPVVAHPPCGPWGRLRHLSRKDDPQLALVAVDQVRRFGGVLEHPVRSKLFDVLKLPRPGELPDEFGGYTIEVCQVDWGHVARKRTWLYLVGVPRRRLSFPAAREPSHWISGFRSSGGRKYPERYKRTGCAVPPGIKICSAEQRRRTPPAFAAWLVALARSATLIP